MNEQHRTEVESGERFEFGKNWLQYSDTINDKKIKAAEESLKKKLQVDTLEGLRFLDIGSGSGLFSLAACNLGAKVHSFDFDPNSVKSTQNLKNKYHSNNENWYVEHGSVLDKEYLNSLGKFDIVYSWGVLHHTGDMWGSFKNIQDMINDNGKLFIAIYNDQGTTSKIWYAIKSLYCKSNPFFKKIIVYLCTLRLWGPTCIKDFLKFKPFHTWNNYSKESLRGMNPWEDVIDWVGGFPFEYASHNKIVDSFKSKKFELLNSTNCGKGLGCNEFVFKKLN